MTSEQRKEIEELLGRTDKTALTLLNNIKESIDGTRVSNCFCSSTARKAISNDFKSWYENYPKENE